MRTGQSITAGVNVGGTTDGIGTAGTMTTENSDVPYP